MSEIKLARLGQIPDAVLDENGYYAKLPKFFIDQRVPEHTLVKVNGEVRFSHVDGFPLGKFHLPVDSHTVVEVLN